MTDLESETYQSYVPIEIAQKMLEVLPLERIHPKDRFILIPTARSGNLFLAAIDRLSQMTDIPTETQSDYLNDRVISKEFCVKELKSFNTETLTKIGFNPRVIVANYSCALERELEALQQFIDCLDSGSQFAFILPSSFMFQKNGVLSNCDPLDGKCKLFEVWQLPADVITDKGACVIIGVTGQFQEHDPVIFRDIKLLVNE